MAKKVLNIECGRSAVRVAEVLADKKSVKVLNSFMFDSPTDLFDGRRSNEFPVALKRELSARNIKTNRAVFVINSSRIATREVVIPNIKENRIRDMIVANSADYFPVDLNEYVLVHEVMEKFTEGSSKKIKVSLLVIPNDIIEFYEGLARDCGLTIEGMDYTGNAQRELMMRTAPAAVKASVKIDGYSSLITIMKGDKIELQRHLDYGIHDTVESVIQSGLFGGNTSFMQALNVLKKEKLVAVSSANAEKDSYMDVMDLEYEENPLSRLRNEVTEHIRALTGSYSRIFDYYHSRNEGARIERIEISGLGAYVNGIAEFITNDVGILTQVMSVNSGISLSKNSGEIEFYPAEFLSSVGVSFGRVNKITIERNKRRKGVKELPAKADAGTKASSGEGVAALGVSVLLFLFCILLSVVLYGFYFLQDISATKEKDSLTAKINDLSYINEIKDTNERVKSEYKEISLIKNNSTTRNDSIRSFIKLLEHKMPSDFTAASLDANDRGITLNIAVKSKDAVADVIKQLRTFDGMRIGGLSTIASNSKEGEPSDLTFTLEMLYTEIKPKKNKDGKKDGVTDEETESAGDVTDQSEENTENKEGEN